MFRSSKRLTNRGRYLTIALGLALAAAACGDSDDPSSEPSASPTSTTETPAGDESDDAEEDTTATDSIEQQGGDESNDADEPDETNAEQPSPAETEPEPEPDPEPIELPTLFEGERVVVVGSFDVWPNVGTLFEVGVVPVTIIRAEGSDPPPDYYIEEYGDLLEQVGSDLFAGLNIEVILAENADRLILQKSWEDFLPDEAIEQLGGDDNVLFLDESDWRTALSQVAELAGVDPAEVLAPYEAEYQARLDDILAGIDHDPANVTLSTFTWTPDSLSTSDNTNIARAAADLGYQLNEAASPDGFATVSFEQVLELDADIVLIQDNTGVGLEELARDPLWSLSGAVQSGNVFERFEYGTGAWIETMTMLDDLEFYLTQYDANS